MNTKPYSFTMPTLVPFQEIVEATISDYKAVDSALAVNSIHAYAVYSCPVALTPSAGSCGSGNCGPTPGLSYQIITCSAACPPC